MYAVCHDCINTYNPLLHFPSLFWADIQRNEGEYSSEYKNLGCSFPLVERKKSCSCGLGCIGGRKQYLLLLKSPASGAALPPSPASSLDHLFTVSQPLCRLGDRSTQPRQSELILQVKFNQMTHQAPH